MQLERGSDRRINEDRRQKQRFVAIDRRSGWDRRIGEDRRKIES